MGFTSKSSDSFLTNAIICALIALPLLAAYAQIGSFDVAKKETHGIVVDNMDTSVKPGDDFYVYTNGGWNMRAEIPPDRDEIGIDQSLTDLSNKRTAALIEEAHPTYRDLVTRPTGTDGLSMRRSQES